MSERVSEHVHQVFEKLGTQVLCHDRINRLPILEALQVLVVNG
jgi:hypothetical protein